MRYLINCSGSKLHPNENRSSSIENISFNERLTCYRLEIIRGSGVVLDWDKTLPAWKLYTGRLYKQVTADSWLNTCTDVLILSALFGWIKHTDLIPYYDLSMNKHKIDGRYVSRVWFGYDVLGQFVDNKKDVDLLTQPYRRAIHNKTDPVASTPYSKFKDNYGTHKGKWLNEELKMQGS